MVNVWSKNSVWTILCLSLREQPIRCDVRGKLYGVWMAVLIYKKQRNWISRRRVSKLVGSVTDTSRNGNGNNFLNRLLADSRNGKLAIVKRL